MQRRTLLRLGIGSALVLAAAGGGLVLMKPGVDGTRLAASGRAVFHAVARAVLDGILPADAAAADTALTALLDRLDGTIAALPASTREELSQLLSLLASAPGRVALAGLSTTWAKADAAEIQAALQRMRTSSLTLREQAYHALRDLTNAAYFSEPGTWPSIGYPGPREI